MRVLVQAWTEIDPALNVRIDRQTALPIAEAGDRLHRVSLLGRSGVAVGMRLGGVTAFALGAGHEAALRHALASGASRAVEVCGVDVKALADWILSQGVDLVIADRRAGAVAARLGWSHLAGLVDLRIVDGDLIAMRCLERGDRERVRARLPAAIRLHADEARPPYLAHARLQAVSGHVIERVGMMGAAETATTGQLQLARPRTKQGGAPTAVATASERLQALMSGAVPTPSARKADESPRTVEEMAEEFVRYLSHNRLLP